MYFSLNTFIIGFIYIYICGSFLFAGIHIFFELESFWSVLLFGIKKILFFFCVYTKLASETRHTVFADYFYGLLLLLGNLCLHYLCYVDDDGVVISEKGGEVSLGGCVRNA